MKNISLELLDEMLWDAHGQYFYYKNEKGMEEIKNIIRASETLSDAGMAPIDVFKALLKKLDQSIPANVESEPRFTAYNVVNHEFLKYLQNHPTQALAHAEVCKSENTATPSTFNMKREVEKAQRLTAELKSVTDGIALAIAATNS